MITSQNLPKKVILIGSFQYFRTFENFKYDSISGRVLIMKRIINYQISLAFILIFGTLTGLNAQHPIPDGFCISNTELKLYNMVNNYRKNNKLSDIPLSRSLCYIAKLHVFDLSNNNPDTMDCNLHSWSDKGEWTECCYGREKINHTCMTSKPGELTNYQGKGYEIAFWESVDAEPENVIDLWKSSASSNDMMLSKGIWKGTVWKSLGVGIIKGYAVVWFGKEDDVEAGVKICGGDEITGILENRIKKSDTAVEKTQPKPTESAPTETKKEEVKQAQVRYYLIAASVKEEGQAKSEVERFRNKGFKNPKIIGSGNNFRISINDYSTRDEALAEKKRLGEKFKDVWIFKK